MQSHAIVFLGKDRLDVIQEPVREPAPNEVLIKATRTQISTGTEMICLGRLFAPGSHWDRWVKYPFHPGYSMAGKVVAVGNEVTNIHEGQRFALHESHQEYVTLPVNTPGRDLYPIPDSLSDEEAVWASLATIVQNSVRRAQHTMGDSVVVIGLGLLGQLVVQYVRLLGARQIIAVDVSESRLRMAKEHGATMTLAMNVEEARDAILDATGGGADVVYDVTGIAPVFSTALTLLRRFGKLALLGDTGTPAEQHLTGDVLTKGLTIFGSHDTNPPLIATDHAYWNKAHMVDLFFNYVSRGEMRVADLITHRFSPLAAEEAYRVLRDERMTAMGVLFDWTQLAE